MNYRLRSVTILTVLLVLIGIGARFFQFCRNDSLMQDECAISVDIADDDLGGFTRILGYNQAAPPGFLILQKTVFASLGMGDITARLIPLIFGLSTIVLILSLAHYLFDKRISPCALILAIALISLNRPIVQYSATAKQYSLECAITFLLLLALVKCIGVEGDSRGSSRSRILLILSPLFLWFSYGAVFIVAGIAAALIGRAAVLKRREARDLAICYIVSASLTLVPVYLLAMRRPYANRIVVAMWTESYMPLWPPEATVIWLYQSFASIGEMLVHMRLALFFPIALIGVAIQAVYSRSWFWIAALASIAVCLTASALHHYPFAGRLLLFQMPVFVLISAQALKLVERRSQLAAASIAGIMIIVSLEALSLHGLFRHHPLDDVRRAHKEMVGEMEPGDQLWVSSLAKPCFNYYDRQYLVPNGVSQHLLEPDERPLLHRGRNWILVMRTPWSPGEGEALLREGVESGGQQESSFDVEWTTARLFALDGNRRD